ncbi:MAG: hypothetical protein KDJ30_01250, partial [Rhodoblastus sp.]|nr:hypothetical protein [Rhodoblastus sp.]
MSAVRWLRAAALAICALAESFSLAATAAPADLHAYAREAFGAGVELREHKTDEGVVIEAWRGGAYAGLAFSTW